MSIAYKEAAAQVRPVDVDGRLAKMAQAHLDDLTKPKGSLGRLEELALDIFRIQNNEQDVKDLHPIAADPARIHTMAGDHGVARDEKVSLFPQEVTRQMVLNFLAGGAGVNALATSVGAELVVVDLGSSGGTFDEHPMLVQRKVRPGTDNLAMGPAMSIQDCEQALDIGVELAFKAADEGCRTVVTGEMGIGNTTPSTALFCAWLGLDPKDIVGAGTGLDSQAMEFKADVVSRGLAANSQAVLSGDPVAILAGLGGLEIAGLAGLIIGAASRNLLILVDGFISTAAYLAAERICPLVRDYAFFSHLSAEKGHQAIVQAMSRKPLLSLDLRLGEGTGGALALTLLRGACHMFNDMATFSGAGVSKAG